MNESVRAFDALTQEFYQVWFRYHPEEALDAGVCGFEGLLPGVDDDDIGALAGWLENLILGLEELDFHALDAKRQLDFQLLSGAARLELYSLMEQDWRHRDPVRFLPVRILHQLLLHPQVDVRGALEECLSHIPDYLRHARNQLFAFPGLIPTLWLEAARAQGQEGIAYLRELRDSTLVRRLCKNPVRIQVLCDQAVAAITDHEHFIQHELAGQASGSIGCGEQRFVHILTQKHFLAAEVEQLSALARESHEQSVTELEALCLEYNGDNDPERWLSTLLAREPLSTADALEYGRAQVQAAQTFLIQQALFELPMEAHLKLAEMPIGGHASAGEPAYVAPTPGDPDLGGTLYFNLADGDRRHRLPAVLTGQCLRNGWPGRHLQAVCAAYSPVAGSLVRRLNDSTTLTEGWTLYAEQLMFEQGFTPEPEQSLVRLLERQRYALLAILDVEIHAQGLAPELAHARLCTLPGFTPAQAEADLLRLSRQPGDALAALIGLQVILALRDVQQQQDPLFSLREFHQRLLGAGAVAAPLVARQAFGQEAWEAVCNHIGFPCMALP